MYYRGMMKEVKITTLIGEGFMGLKRHITERQEQALRLVHHDFGGHSQQEAAEIMGVTLQAVCKLLKKVKKAMPHLFPILTKQEAKCYHYLTVDGWSPNEIAEHMGITADAVYKTFRRCKAKGKSFPGAHGKVLRYDESMDGEVIEKF
jgi:DNA-directed RNA polymerase specialized sigma24 family protein